MRTQLHRTSICSCLSHGKQWVDKRSLITAQLSENPDLCVQTQVPALCYSCVILVTKQDRNKVKQEGLICSLFQDFQSIIIRRAQQNTNIIGARKQIRHQERSQKDDSPKDPPQWSTSYSLLPLSTISFILQNGTWSLSFQPGRLWEPFLIPTTAYFLIICYDQVLLSFVVTAQNPLDTGRVLLQ